MTTNSARKRTIRALAQSEGISYTEALRRYEVFEAIRDEAPGYLVDGTNATTEQSQRAAAAAFLASNPGTYAPLRANGFNVMAFLAVDGRWHADEQVIQESHDLNRHFGRWTALCDPEIETPLDPEVKTARQVIGAALDLCTDCFGTKEQRSTHRTIDFLAEMFREPLPPNALTGNTWRIGFSLRADLSSPLDLYVTDGGLINQQYFWRGEKFQVMGFAERPTVAAGIQVRWAQIADGSAALDTIVGMYPVISDVDGKWATWDEKVSEVTFEVERDRAVENERDLVATVTGRHNDPSAPFVQFRCEELVAALPDAELNTLMANECWADDRVSGVLVRSAIARGDAHALAVGEWAERLYDDDPDKWDEAEPFAVYLDEKAFRAWRENAHLYPSQR